MNTRFTEFEYDSNHRYAVRPPAYSPGRPHHAISRQATTEMLRQAEIAYAAVLEVLD